MIRTTALAGAALFASAAFPAAAACTTGTPTATDAGPWQLVWSDEFDGTTIDPEKWSHQVDCWGGGNEERQCYVDWPENSSVDGGCLTVTARLDPTSGPAWPEHLRGKEGFDASETKDQLFTSARLHTKHKAEWTYGRIEVRARLPEGQGLWPAIWMLPTDETYGPWALSGEIDIVEAVNLGTPCETCPGGTEDRIHGTIHYGGEFPENNYIGNEAHLSGLAEGGQDFHVFAVEWTEGRIDWFLDGKPYGHVTRRRWGSLLGNRNAPFDQDFHLLINLAVGGHWPESVNTGGVEFSAFPAELEVDWVRVYTCPDDETAKACRS